MIEAKIERIVDGQGAAETHAAELGVVAAPFQKQADEAFPHDGVALSVNPTRERVHPDAVHNHDTGEVFAQGLYLEAVDGDHVMAFVEQVVRQVESRRTEADHQDLVAALRLG